MSTRGTHSLSRLAVGGFAAFALSVALAGAFNHVVQRLFVAVAFGAPVVLAGWQRTAAPVA